MIFDYKRAIKKIKSEEYKGNDPVPDILGLSHLYALYGNEEKLYSILDGLIDLYSADMLPQPLLKIDVPKPNFTIRPMSRPENKDWILFEALVAWIAEKIILKENICKRSFSYLNFRHETEKDNNWVKFDDKGRDLFTSGYKIVVVADLTGYYENISLSELKKRIVNYLDANEENSKNVDTLCRMLNKWSDERVTGYGLPQGPPASAFLADIYLDLVDSKMERYEHYYRYMDDIRIFCKTEIEAKKALKDLAIALRGIKLNINAKKTEILSESTIEKRLFDPLKSSLKLIDSIFKGKNIEQIKAAIPSLMQIFEGAFLNDPFEKSHFNFSLYRLSTLQSSGLPIDSTKVLSLIKDNFIPKPHHTGLFCFFLTLFLNDKSILDFLVTFLQSEQNIYDWQEVKILQSLLKFNVTMDASQINFVVNSARDSNKHYAARAFYIMLVGKYGSNRDRELIVDHYDNSFHDYVKTAAILAVQELGQASRNDFYSRIKQHEGDNEIANFINYVKSLRHPLYYLDSIRSKIEVAAGMEPSPY